MQDQFQAGYALDVVRAWIRQHDDAIDWHDAFRYLCAFEVSTEGDLNPSRAEPILAVVDNLMSRGLPTRCSCFIEEVMADLLARTRLRDDEVTRRTGSIEYEWTEHGIELIEWISKAAAAIEPRIKPDPHLIDEISDAWGSYDSDAERIFHAKAIPTLLGDYAFQLLQPQRDIRSIVTRSLTFGKDAEMERLFYAQRVDFAVDLPKARRHTSGLVLEVDGPSHQEAVQRKVDGKRNRECKRAGWDTIRITTDELRSGVDASKVRQLQGWFGHPYAQLLRESYETPLWESKEGLDVLQLVLTPLAVARLHKVLTRLIRAGRLDLSASMWRIAVIERDVPCARLAIQDYEQLLYHLFALEGMGRELPEIDLRVYNTPAFSDAGLNKEDAVELLCDAVAPFHADVLLDISMLRRRGYEPIEELPRALTAEHIVSIRSAFWPRRVRHVACAAPILYQLSSEGDPPALVHLLQDIFRKQAFREGQVAILRRVLTRQDVIALLPTGAGKSLTYQLASLLQPGITIVVDPIKSLMKDQDDNLRRAGIDSTVFINSSLTGEARRAAEDEMQRGLYLFVFISPERLMIERFRNKMKGMRNAWFTHCVIDEAHCVSEWGHDFRTSYLRLGANAREHCPTWSALNKPSARAASDLPMIALTGTASFDVLEDVQRELQIKDPASIITPARYEREELEFGVVPVDCSDAVGAKNRIELLNQVAKKKHQTLVEVLREMPTHFDAPSEEDFFATNGALTHAGLVFAPHRTWVYGVKDLTDMVRNEVTALRGKTDFYAGADNDIDFDTRRLEEVQQKYKDDELSMLIATKAFGMGIDKPNIRYTIHFNMPQSLESFYQEAGRAGRDRQASRCLVLHSNEKLVAKPSDGSDEPVSVDQELMLSFFRNSFRGKAHEHMSLDEVLQAAYQADREDVNSGIKANQWRGIEHVLAGLQEEGEESNVPIVFRNEKIQEIRSLLRDRTRGHFTSRMIREASSYCYSYDEFIGNLVADVKKRRWPVKEAELMYLQPELQPLYETIRDEQSTFKAVYRLSILGVIVDYRLDYNHEVIYADVVRQPEHEYVRALQEYIGRYVSKEDADQIPREVASRDEPTMIRRCLGRLVDFVYEKIASKRLQAVRNMEDAIRAGTLRPEEHYDEAQARFSEHVYTFFDSKYIPRLRPHLKDSYDVDLAWHVIEETEGEPNELKHLRGACGRLLESNAEHVGLLLMRSMAMFLLPEENKDTARSDFRKAWRLLREKRGGSWSDYMEDVSTYCRLVRTYDREATAELEEEVASLHYTWLHTFINGLSSAAHA